jgi:hypothetical protein
LAKAQGGNDVTSQPPIYLIKRVTRWASSDAGDMIQLETCVEDGSLLILRSEFQNVSKLAQAVIQAGLIAEQKQESIPTQDIRLASPWEAVSMESGLSADGRFAVLLYRTTEGVPIELTIPTELARETIERLRSELDKLDRGQYPKMS